MTGDLSQGLVKRPRDQGCPADLWHRDTTADAHVGDPSPPPPAVEQRPCRASGGKRTLNLMKLQGVGCSAVPPTAVPAALLATRARALPWWMLSGLLSRAECWLSKKNNNNNPQLLSVQCSILPTSWQSQREKHVTNTPLLNSRRLEIKQVSFAQLGRKHQHL